MSELAAALFDVDGTLADTGRYGHRIAFNHAFADAGLDWAWSEPLYGELPAVTGGKERIHHSLERFDSRVSHSADDLPAFVASLHAAKNSHYIRGGDFSGAALVIDRPGEPGQPFSVLSGQAGDARYLDVALMRRPLSF